MNVKITVKDFREQRIAQAVTVSKEEFEAAPMAQDIKISDVRYAAGVIYSYLRDEESRRKLLEICGELGFDKLVIVGERE